MSTRNEALRFFLAGTALVLTAMLTSPQIDDVVSEKMGNTSNRIEMESSERPLQSNPQPLKAEGTATKKKKHPKFFSVAFHHVRR